MPPVKKSSKPSKPSNKKASAKKVVETPPEPVVETPVVESPVERPLNRLIITAREKSSSHFSIFSRLYVRPLVELGLIPDSLEVEK